MNPPRRIQVGHRAYTVNVDAARAQAHDAAAVHIGRYSEIVLSPTQDEQTMRENVLHELLHALFYDVDSGNEWVSGDVEESVVQRLTPRLLDTLRRNPRLLTYLLAA